MIKIVTPFETIILILLVLAIIIAVQLFIWNRIKKKNEKKLMKECIKLQENCDVLKDTISKEKVKNIELETKYEDTLKVQEQISKLAYTDSLTELPNRIGFTNMLDNVMDTLRLEETISILKLNMDDFKIINDTLGHSYGDELLIDVTHRLKQAVTQDDYFARFGGDEFIVLSQNITDISLYEDKIKKIMKVFSYPFALSGKEFFVTVSIGVVLIPKDGKTTQVLLKNVDSAMYAAKANGKNTYCYYDETMNEQLNKKIEMQSELRKAIDNRELNVYYQPIHSLETQGLVGFEALLRWDRKEKGLVLPKEFIPLAEETGMMVQIGQNVLLEACKELKYWSEKGYQKVEMAVNISSRQLKDRDFLQMVVDIIEETKVNPEQLLIEITETTALEDVENTIVIMKKLHELGVRVSLDDFGTGYSSLNYIKRFPFDCLKIDSSVIEFLEASQLEQDILKTFIVMAKILRLKVIAEGVEQQPQAEFLESIGCDLAQGYLYSQPLSSLEAYEYMKQFFQL